MKNKSLFRINWLAVGFILFLYVLGAILFSRLPELIPSHWNIRGEVDGYMPKTTYILFFPTLILGLYLLMTYLPNMDPRKDNYERFRGVFAGFRMVLICFLSVIYVVPLLVAMGVPISVDIIVRVGIGVLFAVIGNWFGKVRYNYTFGIKTPWTLANEEVWNKTHRVSGPIWVAAGILMVLLAFVPGTWSAGLSFAMLMAAALFSVGYSYYLFAKRRK